MMNIRKASGLLLAAVASISTTISVPAQAETTYSWLYWQVPISPINVKENALEARLIEAYLGGGLQPIELANLRRDLDGIRDRELLMRYENGLTCRSIQHLTDKLDVLANRIEAHVQDKKMLVFTGQPIK